MYDCISNQTKTYISTFYYIIPKLNVGERTDSYLKNVLLIGAIATEIVGVKIK